MLDVHLSPPHKHLYEWSPHTIGHCLKEPSLSFLFCCFYIILKRDPQGQVLKSFQEMCFPYNIPYDTGPGEQWGGGLSLGKLDVS